VHVKSHRSATRSPGKSGKRPIPLLRRIQMDQMECDDLVLTPRNPARTERSLIDRVEVSPDDMNGQIYRSTTPTPGSNTGSENINGKLSDDDNLFSSPVCHYSVFQLLFRFILDKICDILRSMASTEREENLDTDKIHHILGNQVHTSHIICEKVQKISETTSARALLPHRFLMLITSSFPIKVLPASIKIIKRLQ